MEGVRTFLESSTIHGLTYISTTRKYARLFWIIVVTAGFVGASFLIKESFESWSVSPVKTTIETLAISEITFPKVTVCPPKNTFTDLNYDLMLARNMTLTAAMKEELINYAEYAIDIGYLKYLNKLEDKDQFYNWYRGISPLKLPLLFKDKKTAPHPKLDLTLTSYALSGNITTQNFGKKMSSDLLERNVDYTIKIVVPKEFQKENITINFKLEWLIPEERSIRMSIDSLGYYPLQDSREYSYAANKFNPDSTIYINYNHKIETGKDIQMDLTPGFKLGWSYSGKGIDLLSSPKPVTFGSGQLTNSFKRRVTKKNKVEYLS